MSDTLVATVAKGGVTCIQTILSRRSRKAGDPQEWKGGMRVTVKAIPEVEDFMRGLGTGELCDVSVSGRYWQALVDPLQAYVIQPLRLENHSDDGSQITLDRLGNQLILADAEGKERHSTINLSFLRLRGISDGNGITFGVKGVYSLDEMRKIRDKVNIAQRRFYIDYIRPVDLVGTVFSVEMSSQEVQL